MRPVKCEIEFPWEPDPHIQVGAHQAWRCKTHDVWGSEPSTRANLAAIEEHTAKRKLGEQR